MLNAQFLIVLIIGEKKLKSININQLWHFVCVCLWHMFPFPCFFPYQENLHAACKWFKTCSIRLTFKSHEVIQSYCFLILSLSEVNQSEPSECLQNSSWSFWVWPVRSTSRQQKPDGSRRDLLPLLSDLSNLARCWHGVCVGSNSPAEDCDKPGVCRNIHIMDDYGVYI